MNRLTTERRAAVVKALVEGNSVRATCRMTGTAKGTVLRLLVELGDACLAFHGAHIRHVEARRIQCDEIWSFCYAKERNVPTEKKGEAGDLWTWVAMDPDTKLAVSWLVGERDAAAADAFVRDLRGRLARRVQITADGFAAYRPAIENAFGWNGADVSQVTKIYARSADGRTSPAELLRTEKVVVMGRPDPRHMTTSHIERQNMTLRMQMRRFTRLTNAFSKKAANHAAAVAIHFVYYNYCRPHATLTRANHGIHATPAMAAGFASYVWTVSDVVGLLENGKAK